MRKEIERPDTVMNYICNFCDYSSTDTYNIESCPGCRKDFCYRSTCAVSLYPLEYTFEYPNKVCINCYAKIDMFIETAKSLKTEYENKFRNLRENIRKVVNHV